MVKIYYANINKTAHQQLLTSHLHSFPEEFRSKILKFRRWQDAQLSLVGRLLLRKSLQQQHKAHVEHNIQYTAYNKLYFQDETLSFNISHSGNIAICAVSEDYQIGIDIEIMETVNIQDFKLQMTDYEWHAIVNAPNQKIAFYKYWTQKEAVIKAGGKGLSIDLKSYEIQNYQTQIENIRYGLHPLQVHPNYVCHLAYKIPTSSPNRELQLKNINLQKVDVFSLIQ